MMRRVVQPVHISRLAMLTLAWVLVAADKALAEPWSLLPAPARIDTANPLSLPPSSSGTVRRGTGFFVDGAGHMLTARHAVANCARVTIDKEGRALTAHVVALSQRYDLALLKVARTLGIPAVFSRHPGPRISEMAFADAYNKLPNMLTRDGTLANSVIGMNPGSAQVGHVVLRSEITFGASGAPVLDSRALVAGVVVRKNGHGLVAAVGAAESKAFLSDHGVRFFEDDRAQLAVTGSRAHRAASISARVTCLQH